PPRLRGGGVVECLAGRDRLALPLGGGRAAALLIASGAAGVGSGGVYLARGGRQCDLGVGGDVVRATHPTASPAAMTGLAGIVAALERAQLLVGTPDLHTWPELSGLTADSRKVARGMLYCAVRGSVQD